MEYFLGLIANEVGDMKKDLMANGMVSIVQIYYIKELQNNM